MSTTDRRRVPATRTKLLGILLTPAEWNEVDAYCAERNVTNSSGAREVLLSVIRSGNGTLEPKHKTD